MPKRRESPLEADLARMYSAYIDRPLKNTPEFKATGKVPEPTLDSVIANSAMGRTNILIQSFLKEYVLEKESSLLAIPTITDEKLSLVNAKRRTFAIKIGRYKKRLKAGVTLQRVKRGNMTISVLALANVNLSNIVRLQPFAQLFSKRELGKLASLPYKLAGPKLNRKGAFTARYKNKVISQNELLRLLE